MNVVTLLKISTAIFSLKADKSTMLCKALPLPPKIIHHLLGYEIGELAIHDGTFWVEPSTHTLFKEFTIETPIQ